jgi:hypothetical protein
MTNNNSASPIAYHPEVGIARQQGDGWVDKWNPYKDDLADYAVGDTCPLLTGDALVQELLLPAQHLKDAPPQDLGVMLKIGEPGKRPTTICLPDRETYVVGKAWGNDRRILLSKEAGTPIFLYYITDARPPHLIHCRIYGRNEWMVPLWQGKKGYVILPFFPWAVKSEKTALRRLAEVRAQYPTAVLVKVELPRFHNGDEARPISISIQSS